MFVDKARVQTGGGLREDFDDARVREEHEAAGASGASPTRKKPYFKRCASDSERERHCARFLRKFRENTVAPYPTLRLAPLRRIALLLPYPTARASKAHRPTTTLLLPYARRGGPTTTAASARRSYNTVAPYYYPTYQPPSRARAAAHVTGARGEPGAGRAVDAAGRAHMCSWRNALASGRSDRMISMVFAVRASFACPGAASLL